MKTIIKIISLLILFSLLTACSDGDPYAPTPAQAPRMREIINHPDVALVLGGGGARGFAHIGVIKVLHDAGIPIDVIAGTSAGSIVGALYADQGDIETVKKEMLDASLWDFVDVSNFLGNGGMMSGHHIERFLLSHMQAQDFNQLKIPLIVTATDLQTGTLYAIESGPVAPAVQASSSIPGLIKPINLYGHVLIDGGMVDPIPVNVVKPFKPKIIIAVNISNPIPKQIPQDSQSISIVAWQIMCNQLTLHSLQGADIVIHPDTDGANVFDIADKAKLVKAGEKAALQALPEIKRLLRQRGITLPKPTTAQK